MSKPERLAEAQHGTLQDRGRKVYIHLGAVKDEQTLVLGVGLHLGMWRSV